ncbi:MAG: methionyl-tRNA formyltransferase [Firmicutes bacterium]|nr:methionyl-tRNA formyltransferase [Bacillota bacterium]
MRLVFMGSAEFAVPSLRAVVAAGHEVVGVVTQPDRPRGRGQQMAPTPVKQLAERLQLPVWQPNKVRAEDFVALLREVNPELIVVVAFGQILSKDVLDIPKLGCINVHASLLPRYRGAAPIHWAIINGETKTGVTTMYMTEELDAGDIIRQSAVTIGDSVTVGEVHDQLAKVGADLLVQTLTEIQAGIAPRIPQDSHLVSYAPPLKREHEKIDWQWSATRVKNLVRGLNPWPGAYTLAADQELKVWQAEIWPAVHDQSSKHSALPGEVVEIIKDRGFVVQTGGGLLLVTEVQPAGKQRMTGADFCRGYRIKPGLRLG